MGRVRGAGLPGVAESPAAWLRLGVAMVLSTLGGVGMWSVVVVLPTVQTEFGVARRRGIAVAIFASGSYFAGVVWPPIVEHFIGTSGRRVPPRSAVGSPVRSSTSPARITPRS